jgi:NAD(P)-dependent dehydrogenase (short-subunit alcohol dehydrogenase family)
LDISLDPPGGSAINTATFLATKGAATAQMAYSASRAGVLALSRDLGVNLARRGVRVNALCIGPIDTPALRELFADDPAEVARRNVHIPTGRFGTVEEVAGTVAYLASDDSGFLTMTRASSPHRPSRSTAGSRPPIRLPSRSRGERLRAGQSAPGGTRTRAARLKRPPL